MNGHVRIPPQLMLARRRAEGRRLAATRPKQGPGRVALPTSSSSQRSIRSAVARVPRAGCGLGAGRGVCAGADSGLTSTDAIGVLAVDATGKPKEEKARARSTGKGAGIGPALFLLGPAAIGIRVLGGGAGGACITRGWD